MNGGAAAPGKIDLPTTLGLAVVAAAALGLLWPQAAQIGYAWSFVGWSSALAARPSQDAAAICRLLGAIAAVLTVACPIRTGGKRAALIAGLAMAVGIPGAAAIDGWRNARDGKDTTVAIVRKEDRAGTQFPTGIVTSWGDVLTLVPYDPRTRTYLAHVRERIPAGSVKLFRNGTGRIVAYDGSDFR